jgi:hypothetical protein
MRASEHTLQFLVNAGDLLRRQTDWRNLKVRPARHVWPIPINAKTLDNACTVHNFGENAKLHNSLSFRSHSLVPHRTILKKRPETE